MRLDVLGSQKSTPPSRAAPRLGWPVESPRAFRARPFLLSAAALKASQQRHRKSESSKELKRLYVILFYTTWSDRTLLHYLLRTGSDWWTHEHVHRHPPAKQRGLTGPGDSGSWISTTAAKEAKTVPTLGLNQVSRPWGSFRVKLLLVTMLRTAGIDFLMMLFLNSGDF